MTRERLRVTAHDMHDIIVYEYMYNVHGILYYTLHMRIEALDSVIMSINRRDLVVVAVVSTYRFQITVDYIFLV